MSRKTFEKIKNLQKIFELFEVFGSQTEAKKLKKTSFTCLKLSFKVLN